MPLRRALILCLWMFTLIAPQPWTAAAADCPEPERYVVQRGDTLSAIARRSGSTVSALVALNDLSDPNRIFSGQVLRLPAGAECATPASPPASPPAGTPPASNAGPGTVHVVQRGETLSGIARRYGVSLAALVSANQIENPSLIFTGQRLSIPGADGAAAPEATPAAPGLAGLRLYPNPPEQGRALWVFVPAAGRSSVTGSVGSWSATFFREGETFVGLVGIPSLAEVGTYPLGLTLTDASGSASTYAEQVRVTSGGYAREDIFLSEETTRLLDPQLTIPERERVTAAIAPVTGQRYWQGAFQVPAAGRITSAFGTRRSYNGGPYNSYHAGVDFSHSGGLDIRAPAAGVVVLAEPLVVRGNATIIDHGWGVYSGFWHQSELLVSAGDRVEAGQVIGKIGATGLVTGAHLHWELFARGVPIDPMPWTRQGFP